MEETEQDEFTGWVIQVRKERRDNIVYTTLGALACVASALFVVGLLWLIWVIPFITPAKVLVTGLIGLGLAWAGDYVYSEVLGRRLRI